MDLNICTYNCSSLKKNIDLIRDLTKESFDIIFLQETLLLEDRLGDLAFIDENYNSVGIAASFSEKALVSNAGRQQGGLAFLWKKSSLLKINKVTLENNFIAVNIVVGNRSVLLVNVYIASDLWEIRTLNAYLEYLSQLENLIINTNFESVYFIGDFNADPYTGRAWKNLNEFSQRNYLQCFDYAMLSPDSFTFVSYGNTYCKWLDHIVGRDSDNITISSTKILYDVIGSDHLPLTATISIKDGGNMDQTYLNSNINNGDHTYVDWEQLTDEDIAKIEKKALFIMGKFSNSKAVECIRLGCRHREHLREVDGLLKCLVDSVYIASQCVSKEKVRKNKCKVIPGWNRNVKQLHGTARQDYLNWIHLGRVRDGEEFRKMKESRKIFKAALNDCKINEIREVSMSVEESYRNKDMKTFWKGVHAMSNKIKHSKLIDGQTNNVDIVNTFANRFLINENQQNQDDEEMILIDRLSNIWRTGQKMNLKMSTLRLKILILRLNTGMGHDGIHTSFLKRASDTFLENIASLFNAIYSHCYVPDDMLRGNVNPTIKDLKGNCTESTNYRPVMQSSCLLKIMEKHVLDILEEKISFNYRQFGFKKGTSTTDACYVLKEVVNTYTKAKGKVYSTFIDLSKAFDKVDHFILGNLLLDREVPPDIVFLLMHYLRNQTARIVWNDERGEYHIINEGVRQGGILSPILFKLYLDHVIGDISNMNVGCKLGLIRMNILVYADDIVILSDTQKNLELIYQRLSNHIAGLKLNMNKGKTKCMIFEKSRFGSQINELILGEDTLENVEEYKYLGHIVQRNLKDDKDIDTRLKQFYSKFNTTYRKFNKVSIETFLFLFNSYCLPDYGLALWICMDVFNTKNFKVLEVAYHNALKKIVGVPIKHSNHDVAELCNQYIMKHYIVMLQARYFKRIMKSRNTLIKLCKPFLMIGCHRLSFSKLLNDKYEIDFNSNDLEIIHARISWVQRNEIRTGVRLINLNA